MGSVHTPQLLDRAGRLVAQLEQALRSRAEIDQARRVMMSRTGASAQEAFDKRRVMSQNRALKLTEVAREVVGQAVRRARARHTETTAD